MASNLDSARPTNPDHICIEIIGNNSSTAETTVSQQDQKNTLLTNVVEISSAPGQISSPGDLDTHTPPNAHPTPPQKMKKDTSDFNASLIFLDEDVIDNLWPCYFCDLPQSTHERKPYHNYVRSFIASDHADMVNLDEFMNQPFHANHPQNVERGTFRLSYPLNKLYPAHVTVMEFQDPTATIKDIEFPNFELQQGARIIDIGDDINNLQRYLESCNFQTGINAVGPPDDSEPLRLILVEDLTPDLIEVLGLSLSIPASFFAQHLKPHDLTRTIAGLPSVATFRPFCNTFLQRFKDIRLNRYGNSIENIGKRYFNDYPTNCFRTYFELRKNSQDITHITGYGIWRSGGDVQHRVVVVLLDPPVLRERTKCGLNPPVPWSEYNLKSYTTSIEKGPSFYSPRELQQYRTLHNYCSPLRQLINFIAIHKSSSNTLIEELIHTRSTKYLSSNVISHFLVIMGCSYVEKINNHIVDDAEKSLFKLTQGSLPKFQPNLFMVEKKSGEKAMANLSQLARFLQQNHDDSLVNSPDFIQKHTLTILSDIKYVQEDIEARAIRRDRTLAILTAAVAIEGSKQGVDEAHGVTRLTYLALVFIPLSFCASFFGMEGEFGPKGDKLWAFFALGLPLTFFALGFAIYFRRKDQAQADERDAYTIGKFMEDSWHDLRRFTIEGWIGSLRLIRRSWEVLGQFLVHGFPQLIRKFWEAIRRFFVQKLKIG
ncbi:hypothetical protein DFH27DRAFT_210334 [Peziza echinospora]|nr:hypothetical protein DFH27DRAFT_210334 [Peziza echinospora]